MPYEGIPVNVEIELGSEGNPTGKFVFTVNNLHRYYYEDFEPEALEFQMEQAGYGYRDHRVMLREMERQFEELKAGPAEQPPAEQPPAEQPPAEQPPDAKPAGKGK